ncbi:MAG: DoxX family membrane protein [Chloroflexota bacterium]|nr:MAG: DoxX family membrane protein [Chloroflexota bacterium]
MNQPKIQVSDFEQPAWAHFLFDSKNSALLWLVVRVWVGYEWFEAGLHKVTDPAWTSTGASILGYWQRATAVPAPPARAAITYDWYRSFLQMLIDGQTHTWFGPAIAYGEVLVGIGLIVGGLVGFAAFFGALMNMSFMLAGSASTNPILFALGVALMLGWKVAGYWGADRWILPFLGTPWHAGMLTANGRQPRMPSGHPA